MSAGFSGAAIGGACGGGEACRALLDNRLVWDQKWLRGDDWVIHARCDLGVARLGRGSKRGCLTA
jgi:hypothetical protein